MLTSQRPASASSSVVKETTRLAGPGAQLACFRGDPGWVATAFRDHPDPRRVLYASGHGDTKPEAWQRLRDKLRARR